MVAKIKLTNDELAKAVDEKLSEIALFVFNESQQNIINKGLVDQGTLLSSGRIEDQFLKKRIVYNVPYADAIEYGRLPGSQPPVEPIKGWIRRKGIAGDDKEVNKIAWAIAKDLKKNGTTPRPFLVPSIEAAKIRFK